MGSSDNKQDKDDGMGEGNSIGGKYVRYTNEQVEALERVYNECPKPSSVRRTQLIKESAILSNIEPKQIKVWFQNRRCRERQRLESNRLQNMNSKLAALNKLLVEENELSGKKISALTLENAVLREELAKMQQRHLAAAAAGKMDLDCSQKLADHHLADSVGGNKVKREGFGLGGVAGVYGGGGGAGGTGGNNSLLNGLHSRLQQQQQQQQQQQHHHAAAAAAAAAVAAAAGMHDERAQGGAGGGGGGGGGLPFGLRRDVGPAAAAAAVMAMAALESNASPESAVTTAGGSGLRPAGDSDQSTSQLLGIAEEILAEFLAKATGTAIDFVEMPGLKAGPDFIGRVTISCGGSTNAGVAARAAGLVPLQPQKVAELLKDRMQWLRGCRRCDVLGGFRTASGGSVELIYTQMYAPTTLAPPRDFCTLRYSTALEDGGVVICERSLNGAHGGATMPAVPAFVRAEMYPSGYLIRPCDTGGCVIIAVDHMDLEPWSVPEVLRPLYESSAALAQDVTIRALRYLRRVAQEASGQQPPGGGAGSVQQMAAWQAIAERIAMGFNEAVNGFADDGWVALPSDGLDDVSVAARPGGAAGKGSPEAPAGASPSSRGGGVLCAKASMLLQNVPAATLIRFLRDHRAEWVDNDIDADSAAAAVRAANAARGGQRSNGHTPLPLACAVDQEEILELVKADGGRQAGLGGQSFLLQLCSGTNDASPAASAQLVFAPVDAASTADSVPLLPSGFRVIPLDVPQSADSQQSLSRTLDLASALEGQSDGGSRRGGDHKQLRSVLTIAFQFVFEAHTREDVTGVARRYVRSIVAAVQRIAMALAPARALGSPPPPAFAAREAPNNPEALLFATRIMQCYRRYTGSELTSSDASMTSPLKAFWEHPDAVVCVTLKAAPKLLFANQAGLDMLETSAGELVDLDWEKTYDNEGRKNATAAFAQVMQMGYATLSPGIRLSRTGRAAGYEHGVAWKVADDDDNVQCIAFTHVRWSFLN